MRKGYSKLSEDNQSYTNRPKRPIKNDYFIIDTYSNNGVKLTDIIHSKEFVEYLYKLVVKNSWLICKEG